MKTIRLLTALAALSAVAANAQPVFSNPDTVHKPFGYTHAVTVPAGQKTVYISGQLGLGTDGKLAGKDFKPQAIQAFKNLEAALAAAGAKWENVVKINMYLTDVKSQMKELHEVRDGFINTSAPPASTTVEISRLVIDGGLFEIDAVAVIPEK